MQTTWQYTPYTPLLIVSSVLLFSVASYAWQRRIIRGARFLTLVMFAAGFWCLTYALEISSADLPSKIFWFKMQYFGVLAVQPPWLIFVLKYSRQDKLLTTKTLPLFLIEPIIFMIFLWTNEYHQLVTTPKARLNNSTGYALLDLSDGGGGIIFWLEMAYEYLLSAAIVIATARAIFRSKGLRRHQAITISVAQLFLLLLNVTFYAGFTPLGSIDPTPVAFGLAGSMLVFGLLRYGILDLMLVARTAMIENISDSMLILDEDNKIVHMNRSASEIFHINPTASTGISLQSILAEQSELLKLVESSQVSAEIQIIQEENPEHYRCQITKLTDRLDYPIGRLVTLSRISEAIDAERKIRLEAESIIDRLFQNSNDAILIFGVDGNILNANRKAEQLFNYNHGNLLKLNASDLYKTKADYEQAIATIKIDEGTQVPTLVSKLKKSDGQLFSAEISLSIFELKGQTVMQAMLRDISKYETVIEKLEVAIEEVKAASVAKSEFMANMSHEIRTPMNSIIGMTEFLIYYTELDEKQKEYSNTILNAALSLLQLMDSLLDLSRIEAGKLELEPEPFNLHEMLRSAVNALRVQAREKNIALNFSIDDNVPAQLNSDKNRLRQVVVNLVNNAIKFTDEGGIEIFVKREVKSSERGKLILRFSVEDTGIGIPIEEQNRIFESFAQIHGAQSQRGGVGLGLAISQELVQMMGGEISVESEMGVGSKFYFTVCDGGR